MTHTDVSRYLSISSAAESLGVPEPTLRGWIRRGVIASIRIGRRRLIDVDALVALIEQSRTPTSERTAR